MDHISNQLEFGMSINTPINHYGLLSRAFLSTIALFPKHMAMMAVQDDAKTKSMCIPRRISFQIATNGHIQYSANSSHVDRHICGYKTYAPSWIRVRPTAPDSDRVDQHAANRSQQHSFQSISWRQCREKIPYIDHIVAA
jgi:hypothetical protein